MKFSIFNDEKNICILNGYRYVFIIFKYSTEDSAGGSLNSICNFYYKVTEIKLIHANNLWLYIFVPVGLFQVLTRVVL